MATRLVLGNIPMVSGDTEAWSLVEGDGWVFEGFRAVSKTKFINGLFSDVPTVTPEEIADEASRNGTREVQLFWDILDNRLFDLVQELNLSVEDVPLGKKGLLVFTRPILS